MRPVDNRTPGEIPRLASLARNDRWLRSRAAAVLALVFALGAFSAPTALAPPFFFVQLSDPQFGMFAADSHFTQETVNFELAVAAVNRLRPAFVIVTGDLVNKPGDAAQIAEYRRIIAKVDTGIPVYNVPGNHDVENVPTPASLAAYGTRFGADHYTFQSGELRGIVLNSSLIHSPTGAPAEFAEQERWLKAELARARQSGAKHVLIVQHHPWFLQTAGERDQYFNIPLARRTPYLALFHESGVKMLVSGHYHRNALARDGAIEMVTTGPVGKPLGVDKSGLRVFVVTDSTITHQYYALADVPARVVLPK
jgi:predicted phosphodiesterase